MVAAKSLAQEMAAFPAAHAGWYKQYHSFHKDLRDYFDSHPLTKAEDIEKWLNRMWAEAQGIFSDFAYGHGSRIMTFEGEYSDRVSVMQQCLQAEVRLSLLHFCQPCPARSALLACRVRSLARWPCIPPSILLSTCPPMRWS